MFMLQSREGEVADDPEYSHTSPGQSNGQSNGLLKSSPHRMKYEVNPDPAATVTSTDVEPSTRTPKRGKKLPKKKSVNTEILVHPVSCGNFV